MRSGSFCASDTDGGTLGASAVNVVPDKLSIRIDIELGSAFGGGDGVELAWTHLASFSFSFTISGKVRADLLG